ncbi:hypothetical protein EDB89DRAFT_1323341 [Lactarius sanguifluus]|nr:hypothetical protein EDB89DRAFT_1323341 [Lactarius sanguifluus]
MKVRRAIPLDSEHPISTNNVSVGHSRRLRTAMATATATAGEAKEQRTRRAVRGNFSSREIFEHPFHPSLDNLHVPALTMHHVEPPLPPRFPPRDEHACSLFSDTSQDISRRLELHRAAAVRGAVRG